MRHPAPAPPGTAHPPPAPALPLRDEAIRHAPPMLLIDGTWRPARAGGVVAVEDPSDGQPFVEVSDGTAEDALAALDSAAAAQSRWAATPPRRRSDILLHAHGLMTERAAALATLITAEMGKPYAQSLAEVHYAADYLRWYAEEPVRIAGRYAQTEDGAGRILTLRQPVGPCLFVTPWNFPLAMGARKIAPALAAGCTCVVKPATLTPLAMLALGAILLEAGLPAGVVNIVVSSRSSDTVSALMRDRRLRKISFTGSTEVGRTLVRQSADQLLRVSMELGGNAPFIVFADADLDAAVEGALTAKLRNNGEACTSANRLYVHRSVADDFTDALARRFAALTVGPGLDPRADIGPLVDARQRDRVAALVAGAVADGARVVTGGTVPDRPGHFLEPTVVTDIPPGSALPTEEIFGPVAPVMPFDDEDDVIAQANHTEHGLAAYVYTRDLDRALRTAEALESGMVAVNQGTVSSVAAPVGGGKHSGCGREGGPEGIAEYLETKYLALRPGTRPHKENHA